MPEYTIRDPQTGKTVTVRGDSPPTEAELEEIFGGTTRTAATPDPSPAAKPEQRGVLADVAVGAAKGLGNTVFGLGKAIRDYTPVGRISDAILPGAFDERPPELIPTNTAQQVGFTGEQIGEFFVPGGAVTRAAQGSKLARAGLELATAAPLAIAQGATPAAAAAGGVISAVVPPAVGKAIGAARGALTRSAEKSVAQALGATKEAMKDTAMKVAPEMIRRGVKGSREAMLNQATAQVSSVGKAIEQEIADVAATGRMVPTQSVQGAISAARESFHVGGQPIPGAEPVIARLNKLEAFVGQMGEHVPFEDAAKVKRVWDRIVAKGGLYGQKATASATDNATAWTTREAASAFRDLLAKGSPTLEALNKEYAFWKGVKTVLGETQRRTQAQGGGLVSGIGGVVGVGTGLASGDSASDKFTNALVYGAAGRQVIKVLQSPQFRTQVSAPLKDALARALASGKVGDVLHATARISAALPAQAR